MGPLPRRSSLTAWLHWFCLSAHRYLLSSAPMCIMSSLRTGGYILASPSGAKTDWQPQSLAPAGQERQAQPCRRERPRKSQALGQGMAAAPASVWGAVGPREWEEAVRRGFLEEVNGKGCLRAHSVRTAGVCWPCSHTQTSNCSGIPWKQWFKRGRDRPRVTVQFGGKVKCDAPRGQQCPAA